VSQKTTIVPSNAIRIQVTQHGYEPPRIEIPANTPMTLAFIRDATANCGSEVVFRSLGIRKALPPGATTLVQLPAQPAGEISFSCGMGMFRGMAVITK
jgi:plastocyanin domain-containing protein